MVGEFVLLGEELEREIIVAHHALMLKSSQLEETKAALREEIIEHQRMKNKFDSKAKEVEDVTFQLEINAKANQKLQEENVKCRELVGKLQTQTDSYLTERRILTDRCHNSEIEVCKLKSQLRDLQDELSECAARERRYNQFQSNTKNIIDQISSKEEMLSKEQSRLEKAVKEGLEFATKMSQEVDIQKVFVKEANITRIMLEKETLRLLGTAEAERNERKRLVSAQDRQCNYLSDWKSSQEETMATIRFLTEENKRLLSEVESLNKRIDAFAGDGDDILL